MTTTITHHAGTAQAIEADQRLKQLKAFSTDQMAAALTILAGYDPGTFNTVMEMADDLNHPAADPDPDADPIPTCAECSASVGIFWQSVLDWQHYRGDGITTPIETYEANHKPVVTFKPADDLHQWL